MPNLGYCGAKNGIQLGEYANYTLWSVYSTNAVDVYIIRPLLAISFYVPCGVFYAGIHEIHPFLNNIFRFVARLLLKNPK